MPPVEVAPGIWVATSRRDSTTSTIVVSGTEALLVDPGWQPEELDAIARWLEDRSMAVGAGFATHAHHDHVLWHPRFGGAPRRASSETVRRARVGRDVLVAELGDGWPADLAELVGRLEVAADPVWPDVERIEHDAHIPGHTALWLPSQRVLIAGDMLSDRELPLLEDSGFAEYREGLDRLRPYAERARVVVPGHGTPGADGASRWAADDRYLQDLADRRASNDPRLADPAMRAADVSNRTKVS